MTKILVWIPSWDWRLVPELNTFIENIKIDWCIVNKVLSKRTLVNRARNVMILKAIQEWYDYILFLDDDNIPENPNTVKELLDMDVDIATWIYLTRIWDRKFILYDKVSDQEWRYKQIEKIDRNRWQIFEVWATWWGCVLIKIAVFKKLMEKYSYHQFEDKITHFYEWVEYVFDKPLLDISKVTRCKMWWDVTFCDRATTEWFKIYANTNCPLLHIWQEEIIKVTDDFYI